MESTQLRDAAEVQRLAQEYASYSVSKSGLGNVLGAIAGIAIYLVSGLLGRGILTTVLTITLTFCWLVGKEIIRKFVYRSFGRVRENWSEQQRRRQFWWAMFIAVVAAGIWVWFILAYISLGTIPLARLLLGLACATSMPWIVWRYFHTNDEFMVGLFLLLCCTIVCVGGVLAQQGWEEWVGTLWVPIYSLIMLGRGVEEHRRFRQLAARLRAQEESL